MKKRNVKNMLLVILSVMLVAAMTFTTGCGKKGNIETMNSSEAEEVKEALEEAFSNLSEAADGLGEDVSGALDEISDELEEIKEEIDEAVADKNDEEESDVTVLGEGEKTFGFVVVDGEGLETTFEIHTDEETVGAALVALDLISGDESEYGLYVKVVNGITADYDVDQTYWAFYINDEYATTGVDATEVEDGATYKFAVSKS